MSFIKKFEKCYWSGAYEKTTITTTIIRMDAPSADAEFNGFNDNIICIEFIQFINIVANWTWLEKNI